MKCLVMTKILFYAPKDLAAQLRGDGEIRRVKRFAVAGYHAVVCNAFIVFNFLSVSHKPNALANRCWASLSRQQISSSEV